jgi:hypothetical protein
MGRERFESAYQETAPWDIAGPQPAFVGLGLFLTVYSGIFLQNRELRDHTGGVAPGAVSPQGADGSTC